MAKENLKERFKQYATTVAFFVLKLPCKVVDKNYSDQSDRAAREAAAKYRASLRTKSNPDFLNRFRIVGKEPDEFLLFSELVKVLAPSFNILNIQIAPLYAGDNELLSIIVASLNTVWRKQVNRNS